MKLSDLIRIGKETISTLYPEREAGEMVFAYLEEAIGTKRHTHIVEPEYDVPAANADSALEAFRRMAGGEPLQYVLGKAWFYGRQFHVTSDVLIPRPETEVLCDRILKDVSEKRGILASMPYPSKILDMCTGSGCIAWTLALEMPGAKVTAVDISDGALEVASSQDFSDEIARTGAVPPVFVKADVLAGPDSLCHPERSAGSSLPQYDILVSNPPYVMDKEKELMRSNVLDHEPHLALFVSDDDPLVFYRAISQWALALLKPCGYGIVEINEALGPQTAGLFRDAGLLDVEIIRDLSDRDRFVSFRR